MRNQNSIIIILRKYFAAIMTRQKFIGFELLIQKKFNKKYKIFPIIKIFT